MTLIAAFRRRVRNQTELVFVSDSRLSGGQSLDFAQKIFLLPRSDALFAFAGDTRYAYPLLMQMIRAVEGYPNSVDRRLPLAKLKGHTLRVFQQTYDAIHSLPIGSTFPEAPDNFFLLGGYDWQACDFLAWRLSFDRQSRRFVFRSILRPGGRPFFFSSDDKSAVSLAVGNTSKLLIARGKSDNQMNLEPVEVLADIIRSRSFPSIGGAPQVAKAYMHSNTRLFQVHWPLGDSSEWPHVAGRPLLPGERSTLPAFDPVSGVFSTSFTQRDT